MNKTIIITGVTGGVGSEIAKHFISKKWIVFGLSRNLIKLQKLHEEINNENFNVIETDVGNYKSVQSAFEKINQNVDLLINNASIFLSKPFKISSFEEIDNIIDTNLKGTIFCTLECLKLMKFGRIINIGSVAGIHGIENQSIYSASKYGINGFAESLNQEIIKDGTKITNIIPGGINTALWNKDNPYHGNVDLLLKPKDIVDMIDYISDLPNNVVLKTVTLFPTNEWH